MANNQNQGNNQGQNQGQGNESVKFKNIEANTMDSDKKSIKEQGGGEPKPYNPQQNQGQQGQGQGKDSQDKSKESFTPPSVPPSVPPASSAGKQSGQSDPKKPQDQGGGNQPPQQMPPENVSGGGKLPSDKPSNKTFLIILISIIVIGVAIAGYIVLSSDEPEVDVPAVDTEEEVEEDVATSTEEEATDEEVSEEEVIDEEEETVSEEPHSSMFSTQADATENVVVDPVTLAEIKSALSTEDTEVPMLKEVVMRTFNGELVGFSSVVQAMAPTVFTNEVASAFNRDATFYTYTDENGVWFGLVASLNEEANSEEIQSSVSLIEDNVEEARDFFIADPGSENSWADGGAGGVDSRYITFGSGGAAFNYGWSGDTLIIGTSYPAFSEAVERIQ